MATILLTDAEYTHIQGLMTDLTNRIQSASPRAATHYTHVAKLCADFIAHEDGKRAAVATKTGNRDSIQKANEARRAGNGNNVTPMQPQGQSTQRSGPAPTPRQERSA